MIVTLELYLITIVIGHIIGHTNIKLTDQRLGSIQFDSTSRVKYWDMFQAIGFQYSWWRENGVLNLSFPLSLHKSFWTPLILKLKCHEKTFIFAIHAWHFESRKTEAFSAFFPNSLMIAESMISVFSAGSVVIKISANWPVLRWETEICAT